MLIHLLRRHYGLRHITAERRSNRFRGVVEPYYYGPRDLRADLKIYPLTASISSHHLCPFVDFEEFGERLVWYTFLRDPIDRFRSQYLHESDFSKNPADFETWLRGEIRDNMMVRKLAGEPDVEAAKQILATTMRFVGLQDRFHESLVLMRQRLGLDGFNLSYGTKVNTAAGRAPETEARQRFSEQFERNLERTREANALDTELYRFARDELWPAQVAEFGGAAALRQATESRVGPAEPTLGERIRLASAFVYRNLVYRPQLELVRRWNNDGGGWGELPERRHGDSLDDS